MIGDARYLPLRNEFVDCVITSPPYWSLRKYDIPDKIWDGDEKCEHEWGEVIRERVDETGFDRNRKGLNRAAEICDGNPRIATTDNPAVRRESQFCLLCGSWRGQLGLEPTIELYFKHLLQCFDEVWRVLKPTGTLWINIGDSYYGGKGMSSQAWSTENQDRNTLQKSQHQICGFGEARPADLPQGNIKAKSLCLIPERFAIEMVNRGWILRNKIIWAKPNCMPASVKDRFTVDFEPVFFFVKNRKYWFEQQYEDFQLSSIQRINQVLDDQKGGPKEKAYLEDNIIPCGGDKKLPSKILKRLKEGIQNKTLQGRNRRCVWTIPTQPYSEAHFATFPEALIGPMIRAGCPKEVCVKCGKGKEKIIEYKGGTIGKSWHDHSADKEKGMMQSHPALNLQKDKNGEKYQRIEKGYSDCGCHVDFHPGIVLDPFCGSGTVMAVAEKLNRIGIGFDLGYEELQEKRMKNIQKNLLK